MLSSASVFRVLVTIAINVKGTFDVERKYWHPQVVDRKKYDLEKNVKTQLCRKTSFLEALGQIFQLPCRILTMYLNDLLSMHSLTQQKNEKDSCPQIPQLTSDNILHFNSHVLSTRDSIQRYLMSLLTTYDQVFEPAKLRLG